ncbi:hypothetical protein J2W23_006088 [Variovorax boronicumulans]|uniref:hypothetical protein n=1 Tax=Variovorax boronicumulans TaxID=436515 RepID=UPI002784559A|nr:hypothetical protein [Variovorax boronicumulans]MDQ0017674.1 hypothetical protein [Variovorax boronicumulans]
MSEIFSGAVDAVSSAAFLSSKIAATPELIQEYAQTIGTDLGFQAWFPLAMAHGRVTTHEIADCPTALRRLPLGIKSIAAASYFGASKLVARSSFFSPNEISHFDAVGVNLVDLSLPANTDHGGDNPIDNISTTTGGILDFSVLDRYISAEDEIIIYDKYINNNSCELIEHIAFKLKRNSTLRVFNSAKTGPHLLSGPTILRRLQAANRHISIECQAASRAFCQREHDRYIFFGSRIQAIFSAGLDCFGPLNRQRTNRINKRSQISFFDVSCQPSQYIEGADNRQFPINFHS